jgi:hypothetical protein
MASRSAARENFPRHRTLDGNQQAFVRGADRARKIERVDAKVITFRNRHDRRVAVKRFANACRDRSQQVVQVQVRRDGVVDLEDHLQAIGFRRNPGPAVGGL